MTVSIDGLTFAADNQGSVPNENYVRFTGSGTYTTADFTITAEDGLGFTPGKVRVSDETARNETNAVVSAGANGLKIVAAGARTLAAHGVTVTPRSVVVDVSVAGPIASNSTFVIEMWG
ncbi:unnamed protein product [marine sediment metagenome]|uniref:Uncharacterized protein n=1 Tax=marine sediment metagenome TaxID=412755 RepID=X0VMN6_9ZZZZ